MFSNNRVMYIYMCFNLIKCFMWIYLKKDKIILVLFYNCLFFMNLMVKKKKKFFKVLKDIFWW